MYFIYTEFTWFTEKRHAFLKKREPENYTVYISNIPKDYCSSEKLHEYFCSIFSSAQVLETHITLDIPQLETMTMEREKLVAKLEHAIHMKTVQGVVPKHRSPPLIGHKVDSINAFTAQLDDMNDIIAMRIDTIQAKLTWSNHVEEIHNKSQVDQHDGEGKQPNSDDAIPCASSKHSSLQEEVSGDIETEQVKSISSGQIKRIAEPKSDTSAYGSSLLRSKVSAKLADSTKILMQQSIDSTKILMQHSIDSTKILMQQSISTLKKGASSVSDLIFKSSDGKVRSAGFVTFKTLLSTAKCLQMIHHPTPFVFTVSDAPKPGDIFWKNVGLTNNKIQLGYLLSQSLTVFLCIIWTFPVSVISSLSQASELQKKIPFLAKWIRDAPLLVPLLAQIQPLLLVLINNIFLKGFLKRFCRLEGHISSTKLNVSLFSKFCIILVRRQTYRVIPSLMYCSFIFLLFLISRSFKPFLFKP